MKIEKLISNIWLRVLVPWPLYASTIFRTGVWHVLGAFIIVPFVFSMPSHALLLDIIGFEYESTMLHVTAFNALVKGELAYWIPHIILAFLCSYLHGWSLYDHYLEAKKAMAIYFIAIIWRVNKSKKLF